MTQDEYRCLIYRIGDGLYASPLLSIREVLEYQTPKFMPNMVRHFSGVINVRGAIVGVLDLRIKFGLDGTTGSRTSMLLCDTEKGALAAIVDRVESVHEFSTTDVDLKPAVQSKMEQQYLIGIGRKAESLVTIIDLHRSLTESEFKAA
ncbi:MAG: chemotaxis protein CheW [Bdellovibrio sp.]|jgi:purine-binding chemotaxis protein CheW